MDKQFEEKYRTLQQHLLAATNQLREWYEQEVLTYQQYQDLVNPLLDVAQNVKPALSGEALQVAFLERACIPVPVWLFANEHISPLAKWTYAWFLKLRREMAQPGKTALVINVELVAADVFPTYGWTKAHLLDAIRDLTKGGIIESRKMDYPANIVEHWEIGFLREERQ